MERQGRGVAHGGGWVPLSALSAVTSGLGLDFTKPSARLEWSKSLKPLVGRLAGSPARARLDPSSALCMFVSSPAAAERLGVGPGRPDDPRRVGGREAYGALVTCRGRRAEGCRRRRATTHARAVRRAAALAVYRPSAVARQRARKVPWPTATTDAHPSPPTRCRHAASGTSAGSHIQSRSAKNARVRSDLDAADNILGIR